MDTVQPTSRVTAAHADARPLVAAPRRPAEEEEGRRASRTAPPAGTVRSAVVEALAASGMALPAARLVTADTSVSDDQPVGPAAAVRRDLTGLMHELHEAVKGAGRTEADSDDAEGGAGGEGGNPKRSFAEGLGALVSDVSAGRVPEGLQSAFDRILGDVGNTGSEPSLIGFLTKLQALLGYGGGGEALSPAATGNLVSFKA